MNHPDDNIQLIPIAKINILNPRARNQALFQEIIFTIATLGLKKPITVSRRQQPTGDKEFDLGCGQGRLEAYIALGQTEIPAIVVDADQEECYLMSLTENLARRRPSPVELLQAIGELKRLGYAVEEIAAKIGRDKPYVYGILHLLEHGEERLIREVERERMPITIAVEIASSDDDRIQRALAEAYENKTLRGHKLKLVRRIIAQRKGIGKRVRTNPGKTADKPLSADALLRAYRQETERQKLIVKKATLTGNRLLTIVSSQKTLLQDEHFRTVLRAESMNTMPPQLTDRVAVLARS